MTLVINNNQTYSHQANGEHVEKMARQAEPLRRARSWMTTLRKVNYGLVGRSVPTELGRCIHPARTDGKSIQFDTQSVLDMLRSDHRKGVAGVLGLNYHEISHILYSPSPGGSPLVTRLKYRAKERDVPFGVLFMLANCLEDQRIESLFTAKYGRAKHYFTVMMTTSILDMDRQQNRWGNASTLERAWSPFVLSMGRMYLQPDLRDGFRKAFVKAYDDQFTVTGYPGGGEQLAKDVFAIFQQYASEDLLGTSAAQKRAGDRVADLFDLIKLAGLWVPKDDTGHGEEAPGEHGDSMGDEFDDRPDVSDEVEDLQDDLEDEADRIEDGFGDEAEADAEADEDSEGGSGGAGGSADGDDAEDDESPAQPEGSSDEAGESDSGEGDTDADAGAGEAVDGGNGAGSGGDTGPKSIEDLIQDALDDMASASADSLSNDDVREEYERLTEATEHTESGAEADIWGNPSENIDPYRGRNQDLTAARNTADRCEDVLRRLKADAGEYWVRGVDSGRRINPLKFHGRQPWDQNFWDAHEEGQEDEFNIEAVVLLDQSGSMSSNMAEASAAVWAIHRAFAAIGGRVWVIGFSDGAYGLIRGDQHPSDKIPTFRAIGGTTPEAAVKEAMRILSSPTCADKSKYLLTVTDGVWSGADECDTMIAQMNNAGVITSYVFLDTSGGYGNYVQNLEHLDGRHFHQCGVNMTDISLLPDLMEQIVRQRLAQAAR